MKVNTHSHNIKRLIALGVIVVFVMVGATWYRNVLYMRSVSSWDLMGLIEIGDIEAVRDYVRLYPEALQKEQEVKVYRRYRPFAEGQEQHVVTKNMLLHSSHSTTYVYICGKAAFCFELVSKQT